MRSFALLVTMGLSALASPAGFAQADRAADEAAIKTVVQAFVDTRDNNDAAGLTRLLTADVDQKLTSGRVRSGRDAVVAGSLETTQSTGGRRTIALETIRFVTPDDALADGRYDSVGRSDGSDLNMLTSMVLEREPDGWKIAAIRNMLPSL